MLSGGSSGEGKLQVSFQIWLLSLCSLSFTSPSRVGRDCGAGLTREQGLKTEQLGSTWSLTPQYLAT